MLVNAELRARIAGLTDADYTRLPAFAEREAIQEEAFKLPALPTTTIGSFLKQRSSCQTFGLP